LYVLLTPPGHTLFPYATLFRSVRAGKPPASRAPTDRGRGARPRRTNSVPGPVPAPALGRAAATGGTGAGVGHRAPPAPARRAVLDRKSTRLNSSHVKNSYAVFC